MTFKELKDLVGNKPFICKTNNILDIQEYFSIIEDDIWFGGPLGSDNIGFSSWYGAEKIDINFILIDYFSRENEVIIDKECICSFIGLGHNTDCSYIIQEKS